MYECSACMHVYTLHVYMPWKEEKGVGSTRTELTVGYELLCGARN